MEAEFVVRDSCEMEEQVLVIPVRAIRLAERGTQPAQGVPRGDQVLSGCGRGVTDRLLSAAVVPARTEVDGGSSPSRYKSGAMSASAMSRRLKAAEQTQSVGYSARNAQIPFPDAANGESQQLRRRGGKQRYQAFGYGGVCKDRLLQRAVGQVA